MNRAHACRRLFAPAALGVAAVLAVGCQDQLPTGLTENGDVPLRITASVVGTPIATLVVTVTAADIATPLVFNLTVVNGVASGTIKVPPGLARTITVQAMDDQGNVTHDGSVTLDVKPGQNPPVVVHLTPRSGQIPITVTFGSYGVTVTPTLVTIAAGVEAQLTVVVTDVDGQAVSNPAVAWATAQPAVATVSGTGLVTGQAAGVATIVVSYEGVAALSTVTVTAQLGSFALLSTGNVHTCGVTAAGAAWCWGYDADGELGGGTTNFAASPVAVTGGHLFASVTTGVDHSCGLAAGGAAWCWGRNSSGQLGDGTGTGSAVPVAVSGSLSFANVSAGIMHTCGATTGGAAYCWGYNQAGELGNGSNAQSLAPVAVSGGLSFTQVSAGTNYDDAGNGSQTCGVTTTGAVYCWGYNHFGQLGNGTTTSSSTPVAISSALAFASVSAGNLYSCAVTTAGAAWCWGSNVYGQLGNGTTTSSTTPVLVAGGHVFQSLSARGYHTCGVTTGGAAWCWGFNGAGELGNGTTTSSSVPTLVSGSLHFANVTSGGGYVGGSVGYSCGVTTTGYGYCWGSNYYGQFGNGTYYDSSVPVQVTNP